MKQRRCGTSDLKLSTLGLGCWAFGGGAYWGEQSQQDVQEVVDRAFDLGINYFDTAEVYNDGESEKSLGLALKGKRDKAIIGTKIPPSKLYPADIRKHCDESLKRLQTDYIDLYMVHWPINEQSLKHYTHDESILTQSPRNQEAFEMLAALQKEGKIRYIGISNHGVKQMEVVRKTGVSVVANELAYNLFSRGIEAEILPYCEEHGMGIIGYSPLLQGLLSGKYDAIEQMKPSLVRTRHYHRSRAADSRHGEEGAEAEMMEALAGLRELAQELGVTMTVLSLAWAIANPAITSTIVGSRNLAQLELNVEAASYRLSEDVIHRMNELSEPVLQKLGNNPDYFENRNRSRVE
ncbi:aldo/keto reductase [Ammoniphilus resinae]|uniref:Aryl-alcohol dehydrogenase-like predicted oxidoreductase n=1 Tax=Ammoniphilus resinae TaxID=861532 RepID=A0ABS4GW18_9BACL|nr:aldo/keto reductase [Ammoniphilus resinae]MBP1934222.1 aryl-alcohol dehydrogenase-like predicted oxidoreductase [Ammoniphilus resinae]